VKVLAMIDWTSVRKSLIGEGKKSILPNHIKLPIMPLSVIKFAKRAEDPNANPEEFARIIETDSALTCDLLRYVNSSSTGLSHRVSSVQQAIAILGIQSCKTFLLTTAIKQSMKGIKSRLLELETFWVVNLERALLAQEIAVLLGADSELAFSAGMLQDFLLPITTNELYSEYQGFLRDQRDQPVSLPEFEREKFKWDHAEIAAQVMFKWGFPDNLISCVMLHHRGIKILRDKQFQQTAAAAVALSALIPDSMMQEVNSFAQLIRLDEMWPQFDLMAIAKRVDKRFQEISPVKANRPSLLNRFRRSAALAHY
jgi:HD-like signal output (HDOD) protein